MDVRNFFRGLSGADDGFGESARSHRRAWAGNRSAIVSWNDGEDDPDWGGDIQSSSGREPRRVVRASGRVGSEQQGYRYGR